MIKYKILLKAISFMFLPTLSVLSLILIGFFSWSKFVTFITSDSGFAMFIRIALAIGELVFVYFLYEHYEKQEFINNVEDNKGNIIKEIKNDYIYEYNYFKNPNRKSGESYRSYATPNDDIIILERYKD
jgi:amino acid permease